MGRDAEEAETAATPPGRGGQEQERIVDQGRAANSDRTILIVDDEPEVLDVLRDMLSVPGYRVIARSDAESALDAVRGEPRIDLVITDLRMPGMSGADLLSHVKKILPSVPVVMLTAYGSVESFIQSRIRGVFEYVNKPVQAKELRRIVEAAVGGNTADR